MNLIQPFVLLVCLIAKIIAPPAPCADGAIFFETVNKTGPPPELIWGTNANADSNAQKTYIKNKFECGMCTSVIHVPEVAPVPGPAVEGQLKCAACSNSFVVDSTTNYYQKMRDITNQYPEKPQGDLSK